MSDIVAVNVCADDCIHKDCEKARSVASAECVFCSYRIGFDSHFVETARGPAHVGCVPAAQAVAS